MVVNLQVAPFANLLPTAKIQEHISLLQWSLVCDKEMFLQKRKEHHTALSQFNIIVCILVM